MSSITNDRSQERLRQMGGEGERNYSAAALGGVGGAGAHELQERTPEDPVSVSLHMEVLAQSAVDSNHKVSSAISFVQMQKEVLAKYSNSFHRIAELKTPEADPVDAGQAPNEAYRNIVKALPNTENLKFNGDLLFNSVPLRVSFLQHEPEPSTLAVDIERPDLQSLTKVPRNGMTVPIANLEIDGIPEDWLDQALVNISDYVYAKDQDFDKLAEIRNSLNVAPDDDPGRELPVIEAEELTEGAGQLMLSSLDSGNAYRIQARLSRGAVKNLLK